MHDNDVELVRVFPREKNGKILAENIPSDMDFEIVIEALAGKTIHDSGLPFSIEVTVRDVTDFKVVNRRKLEGKFNDKVWPAPVFSHLILMPKQDRAKHGHVYEVIASLTVGVKNPYISFIKSPLFIIYNAKK